MLIDTFTVNGRNVYVYGKEKILSSSQVPMILDLNCTTGNPRAEVITNGWDELAERENLLIVAPEYNDYATYLECEFLRGVIAMCVQKYPIDESRIYSVGFSNGGAASVALASTYPYLLAGIAAMGWAIGMMRSKEEIPFILIQGSHEYIDKDKLAVMDDEKETLHDVFLANKLISPNTLANYSKYPYWGYAATSKERKRITYYDYDPYGHNKHQVTNDLEFFYFNKDEFIHPIVETVLVPDAPHIPHSCNAEIAWKFLRNFARNKDGKIIEIN